MRRKHHRLRQTVNNITRCRVHDQQREARKLQIMRNQVTTGGAENKRHGSMAIRNRHEQDRAEKSMQHEHITPGVQPIVVPPCIVSPTEPTSGMGLLFESIVGRNDATRPDGAVLVVNSKSTSACNDNTEPNKVRRVDENGPSNNVKASSKHSTVVADVCSHLTRGGCRRAIERS